MEDDSIAPADRLLTVRVRPVDARWVECCVTDHGTGIAQHVGERLFTPFFTTKPEGMGIGLAMCRTVVEQHGGALDFHGNPGVRGCTFRFTLPAAESRSSSGAPAGADPGPDHGPTPPPPPSP
jgi:two-component system sensor histidine kinase DctS